MTMMADPQCSYEIVGALREVFGISDHDLALFSEGFGDRFQIETLTNGRRRRFQETASARADAIVDPR